MPIYQYRCRTCGHDFEVMAHLAERDELAVCPACHGTDVELVISSFSCAAPRSY